MSISVVVVIVVIVVAIMQLVANARRADERATWKERTTPREHRLCVDIRGDQILNFEPGMVGFLPRGARVVRTTAADSEAKP